MALVSATRNLVDLVERLLGQHRAGITPSFGQIESLAELTGRVKRALREPRRARPMRRGMR